MEKKTFCFKILLILSGVEINNNKKFAFEDFLIGEKFQFFEGIFGFFVVKFCTFLSKIVSSFC